MSYSAEEKRRAYGQINERMVAISRKDKDRPAGRCRWLWSRLFGKSRPARSLNCDMVPTVEGNDGN